MKLSIVVPCFNEAPVIEKTHTRLAKALESLGMEHEIIYVDDGSSDETGAILEALCSQDRTVRFLKLSRNFGQQVAITAGLEHSSGDAVVVIDADLQDPPEVIPDMVAAWRAGAHVVYGKRLERRGESLFKRWTATVFYRILRHLSGIPVAIDAGDFRLMDRKVVSALLSMPEKDRFLRGMVHWVGFRTEAVSYVREGRYAGESKYGLHQMFRLALAGLLSFSTAPLRIATIVGSFFVGTAVLAGCALVYLRFGLHTPISPWLGVVFAMQFMTGVQLMCLGILGEYVSRIHTESKQRPLYFVSEKLGFARESTWNSRSEASLLETKDVERSLAGFPQ